MDLDLIEYISGWPQTTGGNPGEFGKALVELRWLDNGGSHYAVHGWAENQPWVFHAQGRSEKAKKAANTKWKKQKKNQHINAHSNAPVMPTAMLQRCSEQCSSDAPSPSLSLKTETETETERETRDRAEPELGVFEAPAPSPQPKDPKLQCDTPGCGQRWTIKTNDGKHCRKCAREREEQEPCEGISKIGVIE
jgi:hypothetical protein